MIDEAKRGLSLRSNVLNFVSVYEILTITVKLSRMFLIRRQSDVCLNIFPFLILNPLREARPWAELRLGLLVRFERLGGGGGVIPCRRPS